MRRVVAIAAIIGFIMPIFWGVIDFVGMGTPRSAATDFFWEVVYITCPPWLITRPPLGYLPATALMNAALYAGVAFFGYILVKLCKRMP